MERDKRYARISLLALVLTCAGLLPAAVRGLPALHPPLQPVAVALYLGSLLLVVTEALVWAVYRAQYHAAVRLAARPAAPQEEIAEPAAPLPQTALVLAVRPSPPPEPPKTARTRAFQRKYQKRRPEDRRRARKLFVEFGRRGLPAKKSPLQLPYGEVCFWYGKARWADAAAPASRPRRGRFGVTNGSLYFSSAVFSRRVALDKMLSLELQEDGGIQVVSLGRRRPDVFYLEYPLEFLVLLLCCCQLVRRKPPFSPEFARRILSEIISEIN